MTSACSSTFPRLREVRGLRVMTCICTERSARFQRRRGISLFGLVQWEYFVGVIVGMTISSSPCENGVSDEADYATNSRPTRKRPWLEGRTHRTCASTGIGTGKAAVVILHGITENGSIA